MTDCIDCKFFHIEEEDINTWYTFCDKKHDLFGFESVVSVCCDYMER